MIPITRHRLPVRRLICVLRNNTRHYCEEHIDRNKPVKFSTSEAANWKAEYTRSGNTYDESPDSQPMIVSLSTAVFLWYFFYYREESDLDEKFDIFNQKNALEQVKDLEEVQLRFFRKRLLERGESTREVDVRLAELEAIRLAAEAQPNT